MSGQDLLGRYGSALMNTFGTPPRVLDRGEGAWVWDVDRHRYLDLRRPTPTRNLRLRSEVNRVARNLLHEQGFVEI